MKEQRFLDLLEQMKSAAIDAQVFVEGMSKQDFLGDKRT